MVSGKTSNKPLENEGSSGQAVSGTKRQYLYKDEAEECLKSSFAFTLNGTAYELDDEGDTKCKEKESVGEAVAVIVDELEGVSKAVAEVLSFVHNKDVDAVKVSLCRLINNVVTYLPRVADVVASERNREE